MLPDQLGALLDILLKGVLAYIGMVVFLRISGKRTLSKLNAFDFVVTIALGSTLATVLLVLKKVRGSRRHWRGLDNLTPC